MLLLVPRVTSPTYSNLRALHASCLVIEEAQVVVHEAHQPDLFRNLVDADVLTGEDLAEITLRRPMQMRPHCVTVMARSQLSRKKHEHC
jgi:hypothetical protein